MPITPATASVMTPALEEQIAFLTGVDATGRIASKNFWRWNYDIPASYHDTVKTGKWGTPVAGTGASINYWFDPNGHFTAAEQQLFSATMALWSAVANVTFTQVANQSSAQLTIRTWNLSGSYQGVSSGSSTMGRVGSSTLTQFTTGTVSVDSRNHPIDALNPGTWWYVLEHEIGHVLGLGHSGPYDGNSVNTGTQQLGPYDTEQWTIMSYIRPEYIAAYDDQYSPTGTVWQGQDSTTWMPADILAIQRLYGKPLSTPLCGGQTFGFHCNVDGPIATVFDFTKNTAPIVTIWDAGTGNTLDLSGFASVATVNLNPGTFSSVAGLTNNLGIAFDTAIDTLVCGSGDTIVTCNNNGDTVRGGAGNDTISGGAGHDTLTGGRGNDTLDGGGDVDSAVFSGSMTAYSISQTSSGVWQVVGPDGTDTLANIEYAKFNDQTLRLLPGSGTAIDWNADPATYMTAIRDFDGNDIGAASGWKLIGTADVNGDGTAEHILVNRQNGRWAEVGTEADGKSYFANHGWAGDTRVVGIYIDPLVASGTVAQGSDFDSQRRFQNDLNIENIHGVLGQDDYNRDGLQEIYFSLTDGTAYLHAYMHADGNIQYANYQNEQQVKDYLTSNGYASTAWAGWFPASQAPLAAGLG